MKMIENWNERELLKFINNFKREDPYEYQEPPLTNGAAKGFYKEALCHLERYKEFLNPILYPISVLSRRENLLIYVPFCGLAIEAMKLAEKCSNVKIIAFDISKEMINFATKFSQDFTLSCRRRVLFLHEPVENIINLFNSYGIPLIVIARRGLHRLKRAEIKKLLRKLSNKLPLNGFFYNVSFRSDLNRKSKEFLMTELRMRRRDGKREFLLNASCFLLGCLNAPTFEEYLEIFKDSCVNGSFAINKKPIDIEFLFVRDKATLKLFKEGGHRWSLILKV
jgi:hypothetical protein